MKERQTFQGGSWKNRTANTRSIWMIKSAKLPEVVNIERAKTGMIYPGGETLIELSATKGVVSYHYSEGLISTRYAVATPKDILLPEYFFIIVERGLPELIHRYLTTINLRVDALKDYRVEYHESKEEQRNVITTYKTASKLIAKEGREIERLKELKRFYLALMFPSN